MTDKTDQRLSLLDSPRQRFGGARVLVVRGRVRYGDPLLVGGLNLPAARTPCSSAISPVIQICANPET
jgi:hypothetical protein